MKKEYATWSPWATGCYNPQGVSRMDEAEWFKCSEPPQMLQYLESKFGDRKFRLYLCGGCRQISHLFFCPKSAAAIEVGERFSEQKATLEELEAAEWDAESPTFGFEFESNGIMPADSLARRRIVPRLIKMGMLTEAALSNSEWKLQEIDRRKLVAAAYLAYYCVALPDLNKRCWDIPFFARVNWPGRWLADCVFGNPFHDIQMDKSWVGLASVDLAVAAYERRQSSGLLEPAYLSTLANELEKNGCDDRQILSHLRGQSLHVLGCWVLDLILGKKGT
jgi:hypothetical protein